MLDRSYGHEQRNAVSVFDFVGRLEIASPMA